MTVEKQFAVASKKGSLHLDPLFLKLGARGRRFYDGLDRNNSITKGVLHEEWRVPTGLVEVVLHCGIER